MKKSRLLILSLSAVFTFFSCHQDIPEIDPSMILPENERILVPIEMIDVIGTSFVGGEANTISNFPGAFSENKNYEINDFQISKYEVTKELYKTVMQNANLNLLGLDSEPSATTKHPRERFLKEGEIDSLRPVESITKYDAMYFCNLLSIYCGLSPAYILSDIEIKYNHIDFAIVRIINDSTGFRLPTAEEWEYAARGGKPGSKEWNYPYPGQNSEIVNITNDSLLDNVGWYCYNTNTGVTGNKDYTSDFTQDEYVALGGDFYVSTHQVGLKSPNSLGIYDMAGNVKEYIFEDGVRGGSFYTLSGSSIITKINSTLDFNDIGFRLCRTGIGHKPLKTEIKFIPLKPTSEYKPLKGRIIMLAGNHGFGNDDYFHVVPKTLINNNILEDLYTQVFVMDYLGPKLKALGAEVIYSRSTSDEIGDFGYPLWYEDSRENFLRINSQSDILNIRKNRLVRMGMVELLGSSNSASGYIPLYSAICEVDIQLSIGINRESNGSASKGPEVYVWYPYTYDGKRQWVRENSWRSDYAGNMISRNTYSFAKKINEGMINSRNYIEKMNSNPKLLTGTNLGVLRVLRDIWFYNNSQPWGLDIPACHVELGYQANKSEALFLRSITNREIMSQELSQSIVEYFNEL